MRALVTGGAGFIGSNLAGLLVELGHEVVVLDNLITGHPANLAPFPVARFVEGDVRDAALLDRLMPGVEVVFHLAASVGNTRSIEHPFEDAEINVIGTLRVLEAARQHGVRKLVYSSSAGIFGELKTLPIREDHPAEPDTPYGASKLGGEKLCLAYAKLYALEVVCLRYFNVYGPHQRYDAYGNVIPIFAHRMLTGLPVTIFGDGEQTRDFVNVADVVQANYQAATTEGAAGAFNIGSGSAVTVNWLVAMMADVAHLQPEIEHTVSRPGDVRHSRADITAAREAFGYRPTIGLGDGLDGYMAWIAQAQAVAL